MKTAPFLTGTWPVASPSLSRERVQAPRLVLLRPKRRPPPSVTVGRKRRTTAFDPENVGTRCYGSTASESNAVVYFSAHGHAGGWSSFWPEYYWTECLESLSGNAGTSVPVRKGSVFIAALLAVAEVLLDPINLYHPAGPVFVSPHVHDACRRTLFSPTFPLAPLSVAAVIAGVGVIWCFRQVEARTTDSFHPVTATQAYAAGGSESRRERYGVDPISHLMGPSEGDVAHGLRLVKLHSALCRRIRLFLRLLPLR